MRSVAAAVSRRSVKPALGYSARIQCGALQIRPLAIAAEVGHGQGRLSSPVTTERSHEQERAALSEYTRMTKATQRLLGLQSLTPSSVQELRVVFNYWVGSRSRKILAATHSDEKAIWNAEELLKWMLVTHYDPGVLQNVFRTDACASGAIINMVEQYLMPFRGTHQSFVAGSDRRIRFQRNVSELKNALLNATNLMDRLQLLHDDPNFRELVPDRFTCNMTLNLWVKRCLLLAEHVDSMDDEFVRTALKGVTSVEECLDTMQACLKSLPVPTLDGYTLLMTAWVNSGLPNRAKEAHALLRKLEQDYPSVASYIAAYNTVLYAYASLAAKDERNASYALDLFRFMQTKGIECDAATYSTVLLAHANSGNPEKAIALLTQMEEEAEKTTVYPNKICYNIVLESLAKSMTDEAPQQADAVLQRMQQMYDEGLNPIACPDSVSFTSVIRAWARSSSPEAAEKAEALLIQCRELSAKNKNVTPDIIMYNNVLDAWARGGGRQIRQVSGKQPDDTRARRAESLLHQMKKSDVDVRPDAISYNIVMNAWFRSGKPEVAGRRARELFDEMKQGYRAGQENLKPDLISYNTLIKLISKSGTPGCFDEARSLIKEIEQEGYKPDTVTYHTIMDAMVKSGEKGAAQAVEDIVAEMEQKFNDGDRSVRPNEISFNILLHAYAMSNDPGSAVKSEKVLSKMIALSEHENRRDAAPSIVSFSTVMDAYAKTGQAEAAESLFQNLLGSKHIGANTVSYNTVLNALAKSNDKDAPYRAETLLNRMQEEYESGNENVRPNQISFSCLLNCWARSDQDGAAERAEAILTRMEELALRGNAHLAPNAVAYSTTLHAWSRSQAHDSADRAVALLTRMEKAYRNGQAFSKPNQYCYNATMNAIAKSSLPGKATKAYDLLHRMIQEYKGGNKDTKPSVRSYATVLNACAYTHGTPEERKEAFRIARNTFAELIESDYGEPNVVMYVNFISCISKLLPKGLNRDMVLDAVFGECSEKGFVNQKVINVFRTAAAPEAFCRHMSSLDGSPRDDVVGVRDERYRGASASFPF